MAIADWIRRHTARSVEKRVNEAYWEAYREGFEEARRGDFEEAYKQGYADAKAGKPKQPPINAPEDSSEST
jgi:flagellar biosynthesis/type III secretory pathway protein FliH